MRSFEYSVINGTIFSGWEVEYADRSETHKIGLSELLNRMGAEGWELVGVTGDNVGAAKKLFLKRSHGSQD